jgi:hypothetical protein
MASSFTPHFRSALWSGARPLPINLILWPVLEMFFRTISHATGLDKGLAAAKEFSEKYARAGVFPPISSCADGGAGASARAELAAGWVDDTAERSGVQGATKRFAGVNVQFLAGQLRNDGSVQLLAPIPKAGHRTRTSCSSCCLTAFRFSGWTICPDSPVASWAFQTVWWLNSCSAANQSSWSDPSGQPRASQRSYARMRISDSLAFLRASSSFSVASIFRTSLFIITLHPSGT